MKRLLAAVILASFVVAPLSSVAAESKSPTDHVISKLQWRSIGPYLAGRVVAVAGVPSESNLFYMGGVQGGIWKSTNYGQNWTNISDGNLPRQATSIGALAVAPSNSKIIYAGTGESDIRGDVDTGVGVFKSTDAGKTWKYAGLSDTHSTMGLVIDPHDPNTVYVASMGHMFKGNSERGVFKTGDGGKTWRKVLFVNNDTGANAISMDQNHPNTLYVTMWQAQRQPWKLTSGGPGSGLYKTTDGGAHWTNISHNAGFPTGILGKMGVSVSPADSNVVYVIAQAKNGGVFRSTDGGATWKHVNDEMKLRQRAFYYTAIFADPVRKNTAYAPNVDAMYKTTDGGATWKSITKTATHGDNHILWVNPRNTDILLEGNDGGAIVSTDGGKSWSNNINQPTGQFYKVAIDHQFPFHVYGAQQDDGAFEGPSSSIFGQIGWGEWHNVALGESTWVAPDPDEDNVTYGSGYYSSMAQLNNKTGEFKNVSPYPRYMAGNDAETTRYRFGWTHPIFFSQGNAHELLVGSQVVWSSLDKGKTWKAISLDLTRNDKSTEGPSGGPVMLDQTGAETFPDLSSLAASPKNADVIWAGSADGLVHVTKDHGANWTDVTPSGLPQWAQISTIEPSSFDPGTAYVSAWRYMWDDFHPFIFKTSDYGAHWAQITSGIPSDEYVFSVRQDPREENVLFATTRSTVYVSLDGGSHWNSLTLNLPGVQVRDMKIDARQGEVVVATHGRGFWILDNLALLEDLARNGAPAIAQAHLFSPETAWQSNAYGGSPFGDNGANPPYGPTVFFNVPKSYDGKTPMTLSFVDSAGNTIRSFSLHPKPKKKEKELTDRQKDELDANQNRANDLKDATTVKPGMNTFQWDMRYPAASDVPGWRISPTDDFPDTADGPTILPGTYKVVLKYGGTEMTQPLTVSLDPRFHPAAGDLEARLALEQKIHDSVDSLDRAIAAAMSARGRLSADKRAALDAEIGTLIQMDIHSDEGDVVKPTKLREQLTFLGNSLENAPQRPTAAEDAAYQEMKGEADAGIAKLAELTNH